MAPTVITRTPLRVSLLGGGLDLNTCSSESLDLSQTKDQTRILGFSINKYINIISSEYPGFLRNHIRLLYSKVEEVNSYSEIIHPVFRKVLEAYKIRNRNFMVSSDIPSGCGLGSSSAFTVGLISNCNSILRKNIDNYRLAIEAIDIEQNVLNDNVGVQDQIITALGGLRTFSYSIGSNRLSSSFSNNHQTLANYLGNNCFLLFTGRLRSSSDNQFLSIKEKSCHNEKIKLQYLRESSMILNSALKYIERGDFSPSYFWESFLRPAWEYKREYLQNYSSNDELVAMSRLLDTIGIPFHRLCGSGGGGFFFVKARDEYEATCLQENFKKEFIVPVSIDTLGSQTTIVGA